MEDKVFSTTKIGKCFYILETRGNNIQQFYAGTKKKEVEHLVNLLNNSSRPNIDFISHRRLAICFNDHDKCEDCKWEYFKLK